MEAVICFKIIFHFLTFQTSKSSKTVAKNTKDMTCFVSPEKFHPYIDQDKLLIDGWNRFAPSGAQFNNIETLSNWAI